MVKHLLHKQTIASDSVLSVTSPSGATSDDTAMTQARLIGSDAAREVLKCAL